MRFIKKFVVVGYMVCATVGGTGMEKMRGSWMMGGAAALSCCFADENLSIKRKVGYTLIGGVAGMFFRVLYTVRSSNPLSIVLGAVFGSLIGIGNRSSLWRMELVAAGVLIGWIVGASVNVILGEGKSKGSGSSDSVVGP